MTCIAGFDISTRELTCAVLPLDPDANLVDMTGVWFRIEPLMPTRDDGVRYLDIRNAMRMILGPSQHDIQLAYVEKPRGPFAVRQLNGVYGAVMASIPAHIARAGIDPQEWRRELGLPRNMKKPQAIQTAEQWLRDHALEKGWRPHLLSEHMAEALLVALAGRQLNNRHFRSAA